MRNLKTNLLMILMVLVTTLGLISKGHANTSTAVEASPIIEKPIMQAGGYSNISNAKLQELLGQGVLLVDIRREEEWQQTGIVEGSKTITFFDKTGRVSSDFVPQFTAIAKPDQPIMLICRTGNRTMAASEAIAKQLGYKNIMNVTTGIVGWIGEKRPIVKY